MVFALAFLLIVDQVLSQQQNAIGEVSAAGFPLANDYGLYHDVLEDDWDMMDVMKVY